MKLFHMKSILLFAILIFAFSGISQVSEKLVPKEAVSVFSINNVNLLQKISLDDLVKYEFMEEVQQELFDGSTAGKTLKDSGIDFDQKLNVFNGKTENYEITGLTFGVSDRTKLFRVFDDYQKIESEYNGIDMYVSYFNRIAIQGNSGILFRISPIMYTVDEMTDSIWYARGNQYPWFDEGYNMWDEYYKESAEDLEFIGDMETEGNTSNQGEDIDPIGENPNIKTYYELRDSVELAMQTELLKNFCDDLFIKGYNLVDSSAEFKEQLSHSSEGIFYSDNSRNFSNESSFTYMHRWYPKFYNDLKELYSGNIMLGDLFIKDDAIEMKLETRYGSKLGSIYQKLADAKMDKNVFKYVHEDNTAFFSYNVDLRAAYEQAYDIITPILANAENSQISINLMILELMDEFLNKDAIFNTYKGGMFGTYSGIKKIKTKKIIFEYNEDTFEYTEEEVEAEEDMPIFTFGFSTDRSDIPERILNHLTKLTTSCRNMGDYFIYDNIVLGAAPLYLITQNNLFILTNDSNLAEKHAKGYAPNSLSKELAKKAKKSGALYGYTDLGKSIERLPRDLFSDQENEMLDVVRGKTGAIELTSTETTVSGTTFNLQYKFEGQYENTGTYILDLINSLYVVSK